MSKTEKNSLSGRWNIFRHCSGRGFTIIEALTAVAVFSLLMAAAGGLVAIVYKIHDFAFEQTVAADEARRGADIMIREIRQARYGDNGAYPIEKAADKELIFYADIDGDDTTERVRYFLGTVNSGQITKECQSFSQGGSCSADIGGFLSGNLKSAQVKVYTEGYYGTSSRYAEFFIDGVKIGNLCQGNCLQCAAAWQGAETYDVTAAAADGALHFTLDGTNSVQPKCQWVDPDHSIKARFEMSFVEEIPGAGNELRRGVIEPSGVPAAYPAGQEEMQIITKYIRSDPPIFAYYDQNGDKITDNPSILRDTKMVCLDVTVNVTPYRAPNDYYLKQCTSIRNIKE